MTVPLIIRDMQSADEAYVGACSHVDESAEWTASCARRLAWLTSQEPYGLRAKVALWDGEHCGFLYVMPIEISPSGPMGHDLMAIQCLWVPPEKWGGRGIGRALVKAAEQEAHAQSKQGVTVIGYHHDFWLMPAPFFERLGYEPVERRGSQVILWKPFDPEAEPPRFMQRRYTFVPVEDKVAIDLFWSRSCLTIDTEAERVREVAAEFGKDVVLREYCADDHIVPAQYGIVRGIYIQGQEISWGYEAPREGVRDAIRQALAAKDKDAGNHLATSDA
jgi:predicted N-acetyltransferase YhbS